MEAYCVKCKQKREMADPVPTFTKTGVAATSGKCPVCETKLYRMGKTEAHEGLEPPEVVQPRKKEKVRKGNLVIVESPAKARTVGRYLGKDYTVRASVGHVRDLLRSQLSVDVEETSHRNIGYQTKTESCKGAEVSCGSVEMCTWLQIPIAREKLSHGICLKQRRLTPRLPIVLSFMRSHGPRLQTLLKIPVISI